MEISSQETNDKKRRGQKARLVIGRPEDMEKLAKRYPGKTITELAQSGVNLGGESVGGLGIDLLLSEDDAVEATRPSGSGGSPTQQASPDQKSKPKP
jgi:hypothetical protein